MSVLFAEQTHPQIRRAIEDRAVLLLPLGQTEQHGVHLQVGCDSIIAERVAAAAAGSLEGEIPVLVLPGIHYGYVPKSIQDWPGSFRIRWNIMVEYVADVCTSAVEMGFEKLILVSTHGPHADVGKLAAREVFDRTGVGIVFSMPHGLCRERFAEVRKSGMGGACHAGEYETSLLLHFGYPVDLSETDAGDAVKVCNEWVAGDMLGGSGQASWSTWALQISDSGAYGDPSVATAETGRDTFEAILEAYRKLIRFVREQPMPEQEFPRYPRAW